MRAICFRDLIPIYIWSRNSYPLRWLRKCYIWLEVIFGYFSTIDLKIIHLLETRYKGIKNTFAVTILVSLKKIKEECVRPLLMFLWIPASTSLTYQTSRSGSTMILTIWNRLCIFKGTDYSRIWNPFTSSCWLFYKAFGISLCTNDLDRRCHKKYEDSQNQRNLHREQQRKRRGEQPWRW